MRRVVACLALPLLVSAARAEDPEVDCSDPRNQMSLTICADRAARAADAELGGMVLEITGRLTDDVEAARTFGAAQNAWEAFRKAHCAFVASGVSGGTIQPMIVLQCREAVARRRVEELKPFLACEQGDPACPVLQPQ